MHRVMGAIVVGALLLWLPSAHAVAVSPSQMQARATIEKTVDEVLGVLRNDSQTQDQKLHSIEQIVYGRFDLRSMSKLVLARSWRRFSEDQQAQYVTEFKLYLSNTYGDRLSRYDQFDIQITESRDEPRGDVTVRTTVVGGQFAGAMLDYRLRGSGGDWKVIDVVVEGISMVSSFRDQFKAVVSNGGPELLLQKLKEKNAAGMVAE